MGNFRGFFSEKFLFLVFLLKQKYKDLAKAKTETNPDMKKYFENKPYTFRNLMVLFGKDPKTNNYLYSFRDDLIINDILLLEYPKKGNEDLYFINKKNLEEHIISQVIRLGKDGEPIIYNLLRSYMLDHCSSLHVTIDDAPPFKPFKRSK